MGDPPASGGIKLIVAAPFKAVVIVIVGTLGIFWKLKCGYVELGTITHTGDTKSQPRKVPCCSIETVLVPAMPAGVLPVPNPKLLPEVVIFQYVET